MPIYEYQCANCNHQFDLMQKMSDQLVTTCPQCSENSVVRMVSAAGFQLKGSGWYETDFKNKKPATDASKEDNASKTDASSKGEAKADKPAQKPKTKEGND